MLYRFFVKFLLSLILLLIPSKEQPTLVKLLLANMIIEIIVKDIHLTKKWLHFIQTMHHLVLHFQNYTNVLLYRGHVRGGARGAMAPPSFQDLLSRIFEKVSIGQSLLNKKYFRSPKIKMLTWPLSSGEVFTQKLIFCYLRCMQKYLTGICRVALVGYGFGQIST